MARSAKSSDIGGHRLRINSRFAYDDWMLEPLKEGEAREVLEIVEARNTRGSLMLCSQFAAGGWAKKLGGDAIAEAIVDRIVHNSYVIHVEGSESMRKRMSDIS